MKCRNSTTSRYQLTTVPHSFNIAQNYEIKEKLQKISENNKIKQICDSRYKTKYKQEDAALLKIVCLNWKEFLISQKEEIYWLKMTLLLLASDKMLLPLSLL